MPAVDAAWGICRGPESPTRIRVFVALTAAKDGWCEERSAIELDADARNLGVQVVRWMRCRAIAKPQRLRVLIVPLVLLASWLAVAGVSSAFVVSHASSHVVQRQPRPGSCQVRGRYPYNTPDPHCTPGALNPAVTQSTIDSTICRSGYSSSIRPSSSITRVEKLASIRSYGFHQSAGHYEYDHLISLELGGAANDRRNLWPENGGSPNLKDKVENYLHARVCDGQMSLAHAQQIIALHWVSFYKQNLKPKPPPPPPSGPPYEGVVHPGAFCSPAGATGVTTAGTPMVCGPASDGRNRWHSAS
jgi:hypothetical protein